MIIDLQECYIEEIRRQRWRFNTLIKRLKERIEEGKKKGERIINLICPSDGRTLPELKGILPLLTSTLGKENYDGSEEIDSYIKTKKIRDKTIELCGFFANVCILQTWNGLKSLKYNVLPIDPELVLFSPSCIHNKVKIPLNFLKKENGIS